MATKFKKKYFNGELKELLFMLSFDGHEKPFQSQSWDNTKKLDEGIEVCVGCSVVLPHNK